MHITSSTARKEAVVTQKNKLSPQGSLKERTSGAPSKFRAMEEAKGYQKLPTAQQCVVKPR